MSRGSRPGERRGGRQRGTPNKATVAKAAALKAASADPTTTPLQFLLGVMRDPSAPPALRVQVARAAAPLMHAKPGIASLGDRADKAGAVREADGFAIDIEEAKSLRDIKHRLEVFLGKRFAPSENGGSLTVAEIVEESELDAMYKKRVAALVCPPDYGLGDATEDGNRLAQLHYNRLTAPWCGDLKGAENEEEAILTTRVAAFRHSQEGRDRHRIMVLEMFCLYRDESEQAELDELRVKYPKSLPNRVSAIAIAIDLKLAELRNRAK
jgi:hypothetical protein